MSNAASRRRKRKRIKRQRAKAAQQIEQTTRKIANLEEFVAEIADAEPVVIPALQQRAPQKNKFWRVREKFKDLFL